MDALVAAGVGESSLFFTIDQTLGGAAGQAGPFLSS
jgi:hypothetical protein